MVASRQVEIPYYRGIGRTCGRGLGALAQNFERTAISFCVNLSSQLQNASVLSCWNLLRQKLQRLLVVEGKSRQLQRLWVDRLRENRSLVVSRKRLQAESFQQKRQNKPVGHQETFSQTFLIDHVELISVPIFCGSFWKSWRERPIN